MSMEPAARRKVGAIILMSGAALALVGLYLLLASENLLIGGVMFGAGILDLILGFVFVRG